MENGSAYGLGVYSALTPQISFGYTGGNNQMFVCLVATSSNETFTRKAGEIIVSFYEDQIIPVFLVTFERIFVSVNNSVKSNHVKKEKTIYTVQVKRERRAKLQQLLKERKELEIKLNTKKSDEEFEEDEESEEFESDESEISDEFDKIELDIIE